MPVEIIPDVAAATVADIVVCLRVADMPIPSRTAEIEHCCKCNERIWVALESPKGVDRMCWPCTKVALEAEDEEPTLIMTQAQHDRYGQDGAIEALNLLQGKKP